MRIIESGKKLLRSWCKIESKNYRIGLLVFVLLGIYLFSGLHGVDASEWTQKSGSWNVVYTNMEESEGNITLKTIIGRPNEYETANLQTWHTFDDNRTNATASLDTEENYDGQSSGTITTGVTGKIGEAYNFSDGRVIINYQDTAQATWSAWLRPEQTCAAGCNIFNVPGQVFRLYDNAGDLNMWWRWTIGGAESPIVTGATNMQLDTWYHIAMWYNGTTMALFLNGVDDSDAHQSDSGNLEGSTVRIGERDDGSTDFKGYIDDVAFYDIALSQATMTGLQSAISTSGNVVSSGFGNGTENMNWTNITFSVSTTGTAVAYMRVGFSQDNSTYTNWANFSNGDTLNNVSKYMKWALDCNRGATTTSQCELENVTAGYESEAANLAPTFDPISDFSKNEDDAQFTIDLSANISDDSDADSALVFTWNESDTGAVYIDSIDNSTDVVTFKFVANQSGTNTINITVWDTESLQNSTNFTITITAVDDTPYFDKKIDLNASDQTNYTNESLWCSFTPKDVESDSVTADIMWMKNNVSVEKDCYQEFANQSADCGGLSTGSYLFGGIFLAPGLYADAYKLLDGSWTTYHRPDGGAATLSINYSRSLFMNGTKWQVKDGKGTENLTVPDSCISFDVDFVELLISGTESGIDDGETNWSCLSSSGWVLLRATGWSIDGDYNFIYEEALIHGGLSFPNQVTTLNSKNSFELNESNTSLGDEWRCQTRLKGTGYSPWMNSTGLVIRSTPPYFSPAVAGQSAVAGQEKNYTVSCADVDGEAVTYHDNISGTSMSYYTLLGSSTGKFQFRPSFWEYLNTPINLQVECIDASGESSGNETLALTVTECTGVGAAADRFGKCSIVEVQDEI